LIMRAVAAWLIANIISPPWSYLFPTITNQNLNISVENVKMDYRFPNNGPACPFPYSVKVDQGAIPQSHHFPRSRLSKS